jgi:serine/threonine protein kinase
MLKSLQRDVIIMEYIVNGKIYKVIKLLGHGKGGYSYLVCDNMNCEYVLKQIHHEPCSYYTFGNKLVSEINDYNTLLKLKINIPKMYDVDYEKEIIIKEYIKGLTINQIINDDMMIDYYYNQIIVMCNILYKNDLNIDYYPTNFVVQNNVIYYIDYECNKYMDEWNFENWGIKYWSKTNEFLQHFKK